MAKNEIKWDEKKIFPEKDVLKQIISKVESQGVSIAKIKSDKLSKIDRLVWIHNYIIDKAIKITQKGDWKDFFANFLDEQILFRMLLDSNHQPYDPELKDVLQKKYPECIDMFTAIQEEFFWKNERGIFNDGKHCAGAIKEVGEQVLRGLIVADDY